MQPVQIGFDTPRPLRLPRDRPFLIAGPCVIESEGHCLDLAGRIAEIALAGGIDLVFKASFDKANRTSLESYRGPGLRAGLETLARVRAEVGVPVLTDVHETSQVESVAGVVDILQIPAFLCRQTDLILACARSGKALNVKKAQFLAPRDMEHVVAKARTGGAEALLLTERGSSFGYNRLVVDMSSLVELARLDCPVIYDATHSVQMPGGQGSSSGGRREMIEPLLRAAVAVGVSGVFLETHDDPDRALSDGPNALPLERLAPAIETILSLDAVRRRRAETG